MKEYYLQKAEANTPPLYYETVKNPKTVRIVADETDFLGYSAIPDDRDVSVTQKGDSFVLDFGRHCVGHLSFSVKDNGRYIDAPVRLKLKFGEVPYEIARDHATYHGRLSSSWLMEDVINIDRIGRIEMPRRYSFRYLEVTVVSTPRPTCLFDFEVVCETSADVGHLKPLPEGTDPELVAIDRVAATTLRDCMQSAYEDGPKRDRRLWSGDLRLQALTDQVLFENNMLARRCLYLFAACRRDGKYLPGCLYQYPEVTFDNGMEISDYSMLYCASIADYFDHTGDLETVRDLFPVVKNEIGVALDLLDENGILTHPEGGWLGFIDWAPGLQTVTGVHGAFLYGLERVIPLARALGETATVQGWERILSDARKAAKTYLYDEKKQAFVSRYDNFQFSVHSQVWMILGGVIDAEAGVRALKQSLESADSVKPVTPYMHHYLVEAMLKLGMKTEALAHIKQYWGAMVKYGADTFWEVFVDGDPEVSPYGDPAMHSFCHAWSCSPAYFIRKYFV
ncbi:MAG: hypothetical protein IJW92_03500 [Clostridia bacterium]|nr:hypothetical protein [Clostridia bacterium]